MDLKQIKIRAVGKFQAELELRQYIDADNSVLVCCTDELTERERLEALNAAIRETAAEQRLSLLDTLGWERRPNLDEAGEYIASHIAAFVSVGR